MAYTTVDKATSFFSPTLYTGTGVTDKAITGVGFQPDFSWIKNRETTDVPNITSSVTGVNKYLITSTNDILQSGSENLKSFDADGFTVGTDNQFNVVNDGYVSWNLKAGTTTGIAGSPSTTPDSYSFNQTSGFSIIKYTGTGSVATIPHCLGVAPKFIITKNLDTAGNWFCYHAGIAADAETDYINLNTTTNAADYADTWNDTAPTSTLFTVGTVDEVNKSGDNIMAYCFADIQGFSKFGYYIGNGTNTYSNRRVGPFIYTGFKPSFVMIKQASGSGTYGWYILDNKRAGYNPDNEDLLANTSGAEDDSNNYLELHSTGFKIRTSGGNMNTYNSRYTYMAFGQALVGGNGVVGTAR